MTSGLESPLVPPVGEHALIAKHADARLEEMPTGLRLVELLRVLQLAGALGPLRLRRTVEEQTFGTELAISAF